MDEQNQEQKQNIYPSQPPLSSRTGKVFGGLVIVAVGVLFLLKQMGYFFPHWLFTWPCLLIAIGVFIAFRSGFRNMGWLIMVLIGCVFLYEEIYPGTNVSPFIWPAIIIVVGLFMIFTPRHRHWHYQRHYQRKWRRDYSKEDWRKYKEDWKKHKWEWRHGHFDQPITSGDDSIDIVSVFGGTHRVIVSKTFKGGDMVNIFGGSQLDLSQADINGTIYIDAVQIFGGAKIIIPSNWEVRSEVAAIFGGIEDKRQPEKRIANPEKVLMLTGASIFGGLEITSY